MRRIPGDDSRIRADRVELRDLVDAYAVAMDRCDTEAFHRQFTPDGRLVVLAVGRERPLATFQGPGIDGIGLIAIVMREVYVSTLHNVTTHTADVDGDRATGTTYCVAHHVAAEAEADRLEFLGVRYAEHFVRTSDGWRFAQRDITRLWSHTITSPRRPLLVDHAVAARR